MSSFDKAFEQMNEQLAKLIKKEKKESFWEGVNFTIDSLRESMQKSGLDHVPVMWLDTIQKEVSCQNI